MQLLLIPVLVVAVVLPIVVPSELSPVGSICDTSTRLYSHDSKKCCGGVVIATKLTGCCYDYDYDDTHLSNKLRQVHGIPFNWRSQVCCRSANGGVTVSDVSPLYEYGDRSLFGRCCGGIGYNPAGKKICCDDTRGGTYIRKTRKNSQNEEFGVLQNRPKFGMCVGTKVFNKLTHRMCGPDLSSHPGTNRFKADFGIVSELAVPIKEHQLAGFGTIDNRSPDTISKCCNDTEVYNILHETCCSGSIVSLRASYASFRELLNDKQGKRNKFASCCHNAAAYHDEGCCPRNGKSHQIVSKIIGGRLPNKHLRFECCNKQAYNSEKYGCCDGKVVPFPKEFRGSGQNRFRSSYVSCCHGVPFYKYTHTCCDSTKVIVPIHGHCSCYPLPTVRNGVLEVEKPAKYASIARAKCDRGYWIPKDVNGDTNDYTSCGREKWGISNFECQIHCSYIKNKCWKEQGMCLARAVSEFLLVGVFVSAYVDIADLAAESRYGVSITDNFFGIEPGRRKREEATVNPTIKIKNAPGSFIWANRLWKQTKDKLGNKKEYLSNMKTQTSSNPHVKRVKIIERFVNLFNREALKEDQNHLLSDLLASVVDVATFCGDIQWCKDGFTKIINKLPPSKLTRFGKGLSNYVPLLCNVLVLFSPECYLNLWCTFHDQSSTQSTLLSTSNDITLSSTEETESNAITTQSMLLSTSSGITLSSTKETESHTPTTDTMPMSASSSASISQTTSESTDRSTRQSTLRFPGATQVPNNQNKEPTRENPHQSVHGPKPHRPEEQPRQIKLSTDPKDYADIADIDPVRMLATEFPAAFLWLQAQSADCIAASVGLAAEMFVNHTTLNSSHLDTLDNECIDLKDLDGWRSKDIVDDLVELLATIHKRYESVTLLNGSASADDLSQDDPDTQPTGQDTTPTVIGSWVVNGSIDTDDAESQQPTILVVFPDWLNLTEDETNKKGSVVYVQLNHLFAVDCEPIGLSNIQGDVDDVKPSFVVADSVGTDIDGASDDMKLWYIADYRIPLEQHPLYIIQLREPCNMLSFG